MSFVSNLHNSNLLECCIANAIILILFGADMNDLIDPDFQVTPDLHCMFL